MGDVAHRANLEHGFVLGSGGPPHLRLAVRLLFAPLSLSCSGGALVPSLPSPPRLSDHPSPRARRASGVQDGRRAQPQRRCLFRPSGG